MKFFKLYKIRTLVQNDDWAQQNFINLIPTADHSAYQMIWLKR